MRATCGILLGSLICCGVAPLGMAAAGEGKSGLAQATSAPATFDVPLFSSRGKRMEGSSAKDEFLIRLPEHVRYESGSELILSFRCSPLLVSDASTMCVSINDVTLTSIRLGKGGGDSAKPGNGRQSVRIPLDPAKLQPGWNRISVQSTLLTTDGPSRDGDNPAAWMDFDSDTILKVAYQPQALFPELQRFPDSLAEPLLMRIRRASGKTASRQKDSAVSILLPAQPTESDLRCFLIGSARLAQTLYVQEDSLAAGEIGNFAGESKYRNGILIGTKSALSQAGLPAGLASTLRELKPGEGCLAEIIIGPNPESQHRWIIVSGGDDVGLENAGLALGSSSAIQSIPSNPWIIKATPTVPVLYEPLAHPSGPVPLQSQGDGGILIRGTFRNTVDRTCPLPPGYQTVAGGTLDLDISHSGNLDKNSTFDVCLNDTLIASVPLMEANASSYRRRVAVPAGLLGRDPSNLQFSSYLDAGSSDFGHGNAHRTWVSVSGTSIIDIPAEPLVIDDLSRINYLLMRDAFLRRAAVVLPDGDDWERVDLLKSLGVFLGRKLPAMPVLWPQVATYGPNKLPAASRVANRSGFVLGSVFQWSDALPEKLPLSVRGGSDSSSIILRGQKAPVSEFDQTMSLVQLLDSPWTKGELFATVGGINSYGGLSTVAILTKETVVDRLCGTVAAVDAKERVVGYDVRSIQRASLAEHIQNGLPPGMSLQQTEKNNQEQKLAAFEVIRNNRLLLIFVALGLLLIFIPQRLAARRKDKNFESNKVDDSK